MNEIILWVDNIKDPFKEDILNFIFIKNIDATVIWIQNYKEFEQHILANGLPDKIFFNYKVSEETLEVDCIRFLIRYCMNYAILLPYYSFVQNSGVNITSIKAILDQYEEFCKFLNIKTSKREIHTSIDDLPFAESQLLDGGNLNDLPF